MKPTTNVIDDRLTDEGVLVEVHPAPNVTHATERKLQQTSAYEPGKGFFIVSRERGGRW